ncbi:cytochrome c oxidase assembly protein [Aquincola tertiaricarbonis]|uniref:Cytochrome c oxidase assembly protein n=1 Tax=Aquincola tertiaricarbonis TaxID=391953 RepID=A0ABY4SDS8_AQUTE|nr:cytochrome c oxidase assembly protein [Aquincola tertiaricarbonis]URI11476.1 cytochrome c oxidase assembly protein [Aquincola tertiaricarbonis]
MPDARTWIPYCGEAPTPEFWLSRWNLDPVLWVGLLLAAAALWLPWRGLKAATPGQRRSLRWAWGAAVLLYVSPLCALSSAFFTVRVVHHMALVLVVAPLMAHGLAPWLRRLPVPLWLCTAVAAVAFWTWHVPGPYAAAMSSHAVYALMQLSLLGSATWFWLAVNRSDPMRALAAILVTTVLMGLLGALITFAARPLYEPHFASSLSWGFSPLEDQQLAGIVMWAPGSIAYLLAAVWIGWRWLRAERPRALTADAA